MIIIHAPGDGFCFFHCVSMFLRKSSEADYTHMALVRDAILSWLWEHWKRHSRTDDLLCQTLRVASSSEGQPTIRKYLERVRKRGFGGSEMHAGASNVFGVKVVTHVSPNVSFVSSCPPRKSSRTMHVMYSGGIHYDLFVRKITSSTNRKQKRA
jgi:hypothetical protein